MLGSPLNKRAQPKPSNQEVDMHKPMMKKQAADSALHAVSQILADADAEEGFTPELLDCILLDIAYSPVIAFRGQSLGQEVEAIPATSGGRYIVRHPLVTSSVSADELKRMRLRYLLAFKSQLPQFSGPIRAVGDRTISQINRQKHRAPDGKYAKVNPCYICSKSAGEDYFSDPRTDTKDSEGNEWGDVALCLCCRCCGKLAKLPDGQAYRVACGTEPAPWMKRVHKNEPPAHA